MRLIVAAAAAALLIPAAAIAGEISVKLDDAAQNAVAQLPALLDQCVAGITMRGDPAVCRSVSNFLVALGNETRTAAKAAADEAAADKAAADEAAKKAATDKPADAN